MPKEKVNMRKTYWAVLVNDFCIKRGNKEIALFDLEQSEGCCCSDGGYILYDTKKQAMESWQGKKPNSKIVKLTTEIV